MKTIRCKHYAIYIDQWQSFNDFIQKLNPSKLVVIIDENTEKYCLSHLLEKVDKKCNVIKILSGEKNKNIETCQYIWSEFIRLTCDKKTLVINLGGGVIGDIGGFCAATFMRGLAFIQVPTTLLSQVDASIGGKLGIDFLGYKNMIGLIQEPLAVFIFTSFLKTLPTEQLKSGYAEMLKHGLIQDLSFWSTLSSEDHLNHVYLPKDIYQSCLIKKSITEIDTQEKGLRKILNFGHTIGHAIESYWMDSPHALLHGHAIAIGMVCEAYLSYRMSTLSESSLFEIRQRLFKIFGQHPKYVKPVKEMMEFIYLDKKNYDGEIKMVLISEIGRAIFDQTISEDLIEESFLFYKEKMG